MDLLLAHGYFLFSDPAELKVMKPYPPLGILYLTAYLRRAGYDVGIFDSTFQDRAAFTRCLAQSRPAVVGLYTNLMTKLTVVDLIRECKVAGARVVLGGPEPAHYAREFLDHGADVVVIGEGEQTLDELLPRLLDGRRDLAGVAGIAFLDDGGELVRTPSRSQIKDLDSLPFPARDAIDLQPYLNTWKTHHGASSVSLVTARGCAYTCTWCSHSVYGHTHRRRTPANVVAEVAEIVERYHPDQVWYADDVFTIHHRWLFTYADLLEQRGLRLPFECISRADRLNETVVATLARMGCYRLWIGSESGSQRILDAMDRRVTAEQVQAGTRLLRRYGIESGMFIMLGFEGEEESDLEATVEHLKQAAPDTWLSTVAYPIKGTPYYAQVEDRLVADGDWASRTERDWRIRGRHSRRYYDFASRWMRSAVNLHREWHGSRHPVRMARAAASAVVGRLGMRLSRHEVEA